MKSLKGGIFNGCSLLYKIIIPGNVERTYETRIGYNDKIYFSYGTF